MSGIINGIKKYSISILDWFRSSFFKKEIELSIIGLQNAGKTTFVNSMMTGKFDKDTIPTIGVNI